MQYVAESFCQAMAAAGLVPPDTIHADGTLHRFSPTGRRSDTAGWYVFYADELPAGVFGCWRSGLMQTWCSKPDHAQSPVERDAIRKRLHAAKVMREQEKLQRQQQVAKVANTTWAAAAPADTSHPYLLAKGVKPYTLRQESRSLLVPAIGQDGRLSSLQTITEDGVKRFLPGGRLQGCCSPIGNPGHMLVIAEGWATSASIHEATGLSVVAAFFAGNLLAVAQLMQRQYPQALLALAADDDWRTEGNPGLTAARGAALAVGGVVVAPLFAASRAGKATDFNDLHQAQGLDAVRACFAEVWGGCGT